MELILSYIIKQADNPVNTVTNNPVTNIETELNEPGMPGSFAPTDNTAAQALVNGLIGTGFGIGGGALADKNKWMTGLSTGAGSSAGYLLAKILSQNADLGQQDVYGTAGSLLGGGLGLGASLLAQKKHKHEQPAELPLASQLGLNIKVSSFNDLVNKTIGQLPQIRGVDSLAGGAIGAGGGALYNALAKDKNDSKQQARHKLINRVLGGAGIGALGANVAGDRLRRYISNKVVPVDYSSKDNEMLPKNFKDFWDSAILDKPTEAIRDQPPTKHLDVNRELLRWGYGVQDYNPKTNIWAKQPDNSFSLNPKNEQADKVIQTNMLGEGLENIDRKDFLTQPQNFITENYNDEASSLTPPLLGNIIGSSRVSMYPFNGDTNNGKAPDYLARILKRWDTRLKTPEKSALKHYLADRYIHGNKDADLSVPGTYGGEIGGAGVSPEDKQDNIDSMLKVYAERMINHHLLYKNSPWIHQNMYFKHMPSVNDVDQGYAGIPTTATGALYPGQSAIKYVPTKDNVDTPYQYVNPNEVLSQK